MTNASVRNLFVALSFVVAVAALSLGVFAKTAQAQEFDLGYVDTWGDNLGYVDTWGDNTGYVDTWGDNLGYVDTYGDNTGYIDTYGDNAGYVDTYGDNLGYIDTYGDNLGYVDTGDQYDVYDTYDTYDTYDVYDVYDEYEYYNEEGYSYSENGSESFRHSAPMMITPPRVSFPSYPIQPSRPIVQPPVAHVSQPVFYTTPVSNVNTNTNINNINTCTNNSCNTNIVDNSINNSFNGNTGSFNTGGINASVITVATPQPIVQYQIPQQPVQNLYCVITVNPTTVANGQAAVLSWSSTGATSAWLNDGIGYVAINGSLAVRPNVSKSYVLTVSGPAGTNTCTVWVNVSGTQPYVSLSQIPYTGFDFGPIGNAMYWMALLSIAAAGGYLLVYYKGGVLALAGLTASENFRSYPALDFVTAAQESIEETPVSTPVETPVEPAAAPASLFESLPVMENRATRDTMIVKRDGGMPRIVINRA